jgi:hypothetical protein
MVKSRFPMVQKSLPFGKRKPIGRGLFRPINIRTASNSIDFGSISFVNLVVVNNLQNCEKGIP